MNYSGARTTEKRQPAPKRQEGSDTQECPLTQRVKSVNQNPIYLSNSSEDEFHSSVKN